MKKSLEVFQRRIPKFDTTPRISEDVLIVDGPATAEDGMELSDTWMEPLSNSSEHQTNTELKSSDQSISEDEGSSIGSIVNSRNVSPIEDEDMSVDENDLSKNTLVTQIASRGGMVLEAVIIEPRKLMRISKYWRNLLIELTSKQN